MTRLRTQGNVERLDKMIAIDVQQNTPEWMDVRRGIPTASKFSNILTNTGKKPSANVVNGYLHQLVAESYDAYEGWGGNKFTERGHEIEPQAARAYEFVHDVEVTEVGFVLSDCKRFGCSPDRLVGENGGVEIKCKDGKAHVSMLLGDKLPTEHKSQVYGTLFLTGRDYWDFFAYHPKMTPLVVRVEATDQEYIDWRDSFETELGKFLEKLDSMKAKIGGLTEWVDSK